MRSGSIGSSLKTMRPLLFRSRHLLGPNNEEELIPITKSFLGVKGERDPSTAG
jgi:hypothetical protein